MATTMKNTKNATKKVPRPGAERVKINSVRRDAHRILSEVITVLWARGESLPMTEALLLQSEHKWANAWDMPARPAEWELVDWSHEALFAAAAEAQAKAAWLHEQQVRRGSIDGRCEAARSIYWALLALATVGKCCALPHEIEAAQALLRCAAYDESDAAMFSADPVDTRRPKKKTPKKRRS